MLGILGGTSFLNTDLLKQVNWKTVYTRFGECDVAFTEQIAFIPRHGRDGYRPPHKINHRAHLSAFEKNGVTKILSFGSVGSLKPVILPGTLLVPGDLFSPFKITTFQDEELEYIVPGFEPEWRSEILQKLAKAALHPEDGGVYAETLGPRFETPAEIRFLGQWADVVGMTCASEAFLANELRLPQAIICIVDNYANGIGVEPLTGDAFKELVRKNHNLAMAAFEAVTQ